MARIPAPPTPREKTKTEIAIDAAIDADGGNRYRALLQKWLPKVEDAYRQDDPNDKHRSHLGASLIGRECERELWFGWRWAGVKKFKARMLRLFNRGHREEAQFLALLEMIGVHIHEQPDGGQERISAYNGHFGSALDGVLYGVPDCPNEWILGEFKTHNTKSFCKLVAEGVAKAKPEHMGQMQACMRQRGIHTCLYMAVNKNDDDLYCEIIRYVPQFGDQYLERAGRIIFARTAPARISEDPSAFKCKMCDWVEQCHYGKGALRNCRTCRHSVADPGGTWGCELHGHTLDKAAQLAACDGYDPMPEMKGK